MREKFRIDLFDELLINIVERPHRAVVRPDPILITKRMGILQRDVSHRSSAHVHNRIVRRNRSRMLAKDCIFIRRRHVFVNDRLAVLIIADAPAIRMREVAAIILALLHQCIRGVEQRICERHRYV